MTVDLPTLIEIRKRMEQAAIPLLFHEVKTPERQARRIARILGWMGSTGRMVTTEYVMRPSWKPCEPPDTKLRFKRGGLA